VEETRGHCSLSRRSRPCLGSDWVTAGSEPPPFSRASAAGFQVTILRASRPESLPAARAVAGPAAIATVVSFSRGSECAWCSSDRAGRSSRDAQAPAVDRTCLASAPNPLQTLKRSALGRTRSRRYPPTEGSIVSIRRRPHGGHSDRSQRLSNVGSSLYILMSSIRLSMPKSVNAMTPSSPTP
jgi:hypothetical protein